MSTQPQSESARPAFLSRLRSWRRIVAATLVVAVTDAAFAFVVYVLLAGRYNFQTLLQYIASGLTGPVAFSTGIAGVGYAALGFGIHLAISAVFVVVYGADRPAGPHPGSGGDRWAALRRVDLVVHEHRGPAAGAIHP